VQRYTCAASVLGSVERDFLYFFEHGVGEDIKVILDLVFLEVDVEDEKDLLIVGADKRLLDGSRGLLRTCNKVWLFIILQLGQLANQCTHQLGDLFQEWISLSDSFIKDINKEIHQTQVVVNENRALVLAVGRQGAVEEESHCDLEMLACVDHDFFDEVRTVVEPIICDDAVWAMLGCCLGWETFNLALSFAITPLSYHTLFLHLNQQTVIVLHLILNLLHKLLLLHLLLPQHQILLL
jgi:hypothetical protein